MCAKLSSIPSLCQHYPHFQYSKDLSSARHTNMLTQTQAKVMSHQREGASRLSMNDRDSMRGDRYRGHDMKSRGREHEDRAIGSSRRGDSRRYQDSQYERREYQERDRERERERDRERYDRAREGKYDERSSRNHRRSASPKSRSSRPRSSSGDRSPKPEKAKPNFAQSGLLAAETNTVKAADGTSTVLKYNEPPEARKPTLSWRLYVFKGSEQVGKSQIFASSSASSLMRSCLSSELLHIQRQSAYLIGRDRLVADIAVDHPSCSKQHAVIQCK